MPVIIDGTLGIIAPAAAGISTANTINESNNINDGTNRASVGPITLTAGVITITSGIWKIL
jgi:hypothetical protein